MKFEPVIFFLDLLTDSVELFYYGENKLKMTPDGTIMAFYYEGEGITVSKVTNQLTKEKIVFVRDTHNVIRTFLYLPMEGIWPMELGWLGANIPTLFVFGIKP